MIEDWDNVEYDLSCETPIYETYGLSPINKLCFKYLEFTGEMMQWCKDNARYVSLTIIPPVSGILEDTVYNVTFYTKEEYEEFCKRFKQEIGEPDVKSYGCNEKGRVDMEKKDNKTVEDYKEKLFDLIRSGEARTMQDVENASMYYFNRYLNEGEDYGIQTAVSRFLGTTNYEYPFNVMLPFVNQFLMSHKYIKLSQEDIANWLRAECGIGNYKAFSEDVRKELEKKVKQHNLMIDRLAGRGDNKRREDDINENKEDDKVGEQPEEQGSWWVAFCKSFDGLEEHTLGYIKLVLKDYKNPWEELSAERKDAVKCMIRDYWYTHNKELVNSVKDWLDFSKVSLTAVTLSELLGEQYCVETLCLGKEARDSLFHMTSTGKVYKEAVLKKFSDWFDTFDWYGPPTLEYSLQHISEVEGIDVDAISDEIKEEVRKMIDKKTKEIEARGKVTQQRDGKGRFIKNRGKIRVDSHLYADSVVGIYDYLRLAEYRVAEDFHDTERVLFIIKYVGSLLNSTEGITEEEGSELISMRFGLDSYCKVKDFVGSTGREVTIWIPHNMYFAGSRDNLIPFTLTYEARNRFPVDIKRPEA